MSKKKAETYYNMNSPEEPYVESENKPKEDNYDEFTFSQNNLGNLYNEILDSINAQEPIFLFSKERLNTRIALNVIKQRLIVEQIKSLSEMTDEFMKLEVKKIFSPLGMKYLLMGEISKAQQEFAQNAEIHLTLIKAEQAKRIDLDLLHQEKKADIASKELDNKEKEIKISLIEELKNSVDFKNLSPAYQSALIATYLNADADKLNRIDMQAGLKNALEQQAQAEADKKTAEAARANSENKAFDWKLDRDKKSVEKNDKH